MDITFTLKTQEIVPVHHQDPVVLLPTAFTHLLYVKAGEADVTFGKTLWHLTPGDTLLLAPYCSLSLVSDTPEAALFDYSYLIGSNEYLLLDEGVVRIFSADSELSSTMARYCSFHSYANPGEQLLQKALEYYLIYLSEKVLTPFGRSISSKMLPVITYIENNLQQNISTADLARLFHSSESSVYKLFSASLGLSPKQFIMRRRMHRALILLSGSDKSIADIAFETGFYDQYYFSKEFKKFFGSSPANYRKALRNC